MKDYLTLEYMISKGLSLQQACMVMEAVSSCAIENPKCASKKTVDAVIERIKKEPYKEN